MCVNDDWGKELCLCSRKNFGTKSMLLASLDFQPPWTRAYFSFNFIHNFNFKRFCDFFRCWRFNFFFFVDVSGDTFFLCFVNPAINFYEIFFFSARVNRLVFLVKIV